MKNFHIMAKRFNKGVKTEIYVGSRVFWKKFSLEEDTNLYLFLVFLREIGLARKLQFCQECFLGVRGNFPNDTFLEEAKLFKL